VEQAAEQAVQVEQAAEHCLKNRNHLEMRETNFLNNIKILIISGGQIFASDPELFNLKVIRYFMLLTLSYGEPNK
jgi:hypothetical protein